MEPELRGPEVLCKVDNNSVGIFSTIECNGNVVERELRAVEFGDPDATAEGLPFSKLARIGQPRQDDEHEVTCLLMLHARRRCGRAVVVATWRARRFCVT